MPMECTSCCSLLRVVTAGVYREVEGSNGRMGRLVPRKIWRCDYCGYAEPYFDHYVFGECTYCGARVVEMDYAENFPDQPVRLLAASAAHPDRMDEGDYRYGCSKCLRCAMCKKSLPKQDVEARGKRTYDWDGTMIIEWDYMHEECARDWDRRYAADNLSGALVDIKDVIDTLVNHKRIAELNATKGIF
jgi:hypothetical protein